MPRSRPGQYTRDYYKVPAYIGARVSFQGRTGKITGFRSARLLIKFDDEDRGSRALFHPTWEIKYL